MTDRSAAATLSHEESWIRLGESGVCRLAVTTDDGVTIVPVDYRVHDGAVYFRSAPGTKLAAIARHPQAAIEVEGRSGHARWTVVVSGLARRLDSDEEILASGILDLAGSIGGARDNFVRLDPTRVTGRRFPARADD